MLSALALFAVLTPLMILQSATQQTTPVQEGSGPTAQVQVQPDAPLHIGGDVQAPVLIHSVEPKFSAAARAAIQGGKVQVYLWVDKQGLPTHVRVIKGVGMGLDEKAVEAIRQYRFKPATLNGEPVVVDLYIDVNFQIFKNK